MMSSLFQTWLQLWFPSDYATTPSAFEGLSAMSYFLFMLNKLPGVAFSKDGVAGFDVRGVQVRAPRRATAVRVPGSMCKPLGCLRMRMRISGGVPCS
jgi:hypothetical protein